MTHFRLQLEFAPHARRVSYAKLALLLVSVLLFVAAAVLFGLKLTTNARQARSLAAMDNSANTPATITPRASRPDPAELARVTLVRKTAHSLGTPWTALLAALEAAPTNVALLSVEPSAATRSVALTAEAANAKEMLDYLRALQSDNRLSNVTLVSHQVQVQAPGSPTRFQIQGNWKGNP